MKETVIIDLRLQNQRYQGYWRADRTNYWLRVSTKASQSSGGLDSKWVPASFRVFVSSLLNNLENNCSSVTMFAIGSDKDWFLEVQISHYHFLDFCVMSTSDLAARPGQVLPQPNLHTILWDTETFLFSQRCLDAVLGAMLKELDMNT